MRPAVLRHQEFLDRHLAGLDVHLDDGDMAGVGESAGRIVGAALGQARLDLAVEAVRLRIGLARHLGDADGAVGAGDLGLAVFQHDVVGRRLQHMAGDLDQLGAHLARRDAARRRRRSPASGWRRCPSHRARVSVSPCTTLMMSGATPSSSAMICASVVRRPWPCGEEPMRASTKPDGSTETITCLPAGRDLHAARGEGRRCRSRCARRRWRSRCRDGGLWRALLSAARGRRAGRCA